jgi:hypothetical protein
MSQAIPASATPTSSSLSNFRPRSRISDVDYFTGIKSEWRGWKMQMLIKLQVDGEAIGEELNRIGYVYSRLKDKPRDIVTTYVETAFKQFNRDLHSVEILIGRLEISYGDAHRVEKAISKLHTIKQGEYESFANFFPKLESLITTADADLWPDATKITYVRNALNDRLRAQLIGASYEDLTIYSRFVTKCEQLSSQMEMMGMWKKKDGKKDVRPAYQRPTVPIEEKMEWEPTPYDTTRVNATRGYRYDPPNPDGYPSTRVEDRNLLGKRAKWVDYREMNARKEEGRCLRCGRSNCRIITCPLAMAINPARNNSTRLRENRIKPRVQILEAAVELDQKASDSEDSEKE